MKFRSLLTGIVTVLSLLLTSQATSASMASQPRSGTLSSTGVKITYKDEVKLTSRKCGEVEVKYSVRIDPAKATVIFSDRSGRKLGGQLINRYSEFQTEWDAPQGVIYFDYCKTRWKDDFGEWYPAFQGGWVTVTLTVYDPYGGSTKKTGKFFVKK